jgi:hypothetical protein
LDFLHLIETEFLGPTVVELRGARAGMICHPRGTVAWIDEKVAANAAPSEFI